MVSAVCLEERELSMSFDGFKSPLVITVIVLVFGCAMLVGLMRNTSQKTSVRVFHAAGLAPFLMRIHDESEHDLHLSLQLESSGSMEACRKVTELGRPCDVLMLADEALVKTHLSAVCHWRIDFSADQLVLGVGVHAPNIEEAERNWSTAVLRPHVRLARVNENLSPIGYRTLIALKLQQQLDGVPLSHRYLAKCALVVDDVERIPALLKGGDIDYAIVYRSTCIAHGIRYIPLDIRVNLGSTTIDYRKTTIHFQRLKSGTPETVTVHGAPIIWTLTLPTISEHPAQAKAFIQYLLTKQLSKLADAGFTPLPHTIFYGSHEDFLAYNTLTQYGGPL